MVLIFKRGKEKGRNTFLGVNIKALLVPTLFSPMTAEVKMEKKNCYTALKYQLIQKCILISILYTLKSNVPEIQLKR